MTTASPSHRRRHKPAPWRRALDVTIRIVSAIVAGYFVAHAFAALMAAVLPFARPDRVVAGSMLAFVAWTIVAIHAFAARSPWRAAGVPLLLGLAMLGLAGLLAAQAARP